MKRRKPGTKRGKSGRRRAVSSATRVSPSSVRRKSAKRGALSLRASMAEALKFYRPIKKPVTLRLDADVIAWFKKDGRRYQTRINAALRRVMDREMRSGK
jgi:uncharacterized protein (DUF4415 family)